MNNLRVLLLAGASLFINLSLSAQKLPLRFGIKAGLNLSNAIVNDAAGTTSKLGYHIGGTLEYSLSEKFLIQSGLYYATKDAEVYALNGSKYVPSPPDDTHTFNASYLTVPVYGAFKVRVTNDFNIVFGVGPYVGYGIGGKTRQKLNTGTWGDGDTEKDWETFGDGVFDENRSWLRGTTLKRLDIGVGTNIDFAYHNFILSVGYEQGLRNSAVQDYHQHLQYRNSVMQVSVGYKL